MTRTTRITRVIGTANLSAHSKTATRAQRGNRVQQVAICNRIADDDCFIYILPCNYRNRHATDYVSIDNAVSIAMTKVTCYHSWQSAREIRLFEKTLGP